MAFLFLFFTVALTLCVVGIIVVALAAILGRVRDDWKLQKKERKPRPRNF
jgi:type IV secretory pathway VirB2 component (pilin)